MEFLILGPMEVLDGDRHVALPMGRGRSLLALLALRANTPVATERLIDELWGEHPPPTAATAMQGLVSRLRKRLEPERTKGGAATVLETLGNSYRLAIDPESVDANRFQRLVVDAKGQTPDVCAAMLKSALALWRGPALADFVYEPFAQRSIVALEETRVEATETWFETEVARGRATELIAELQEAITTYPLRERLRGSLMVALYRAGRQAEALEAYRQTRSFFLEEIGVEPGPALRELEAAILRQNPSLEWRQTTQPQLQETATSWLPSERRSVTVATIDVTPSTTSDLDAETVARASSMSKSVAVNVLEDHGARIESPVGDELIAFFGFPLAHEDDALRAIRALMVVRTTVHALNDSSAIEGLRYAARAALETGDIFVAGPGGALGDVVSGPVVSSVRRLQRGADEGEIVVGPAARRLLRGSVIFTPSDDLVGSSARVWRVLDVIRRAQVIPRALDAPMIGRQDELSRLRATFHRATRTRTVARAIVVGDPGIGKSRLAEEVVGSIGDDAHAIALRCVPSEDAFGFFPVRQVVIEAAGALGWRRLHDALETRSEVDGVAAAISLRCPPASSHELFPAVKNLFESLADERPLVVVVDDLQWADAAFLELLDQIEQEMAKPILLLCLARSELMEESRAFTGELVALEPLTDAELASLVIDRGGPRVQSTLQRIVTLAQGNPLYAEQLLAAAEEGDVGSIPATLAGLLSMRLDHLGPGERDLLRCASVAGMEVDVDLVTALLPEEARPFVERHLQTLERRHLLKPTGPGRFGFVHALIQMTAYRSMTREDRDRLHKEVQERQLPEKR